MCILLEPVQCRPELWCVIAEPMLRLELLQSLPTSIECIGGDRRGPCSGLTVQQVRAHFYCRPGEGPLLTPRARWTARAPHGPHHFLRNLQLQLGIYYQEHSRMELSETWRIFGNFSIHFWRRRSIFQPRPTQLPLEFTMAIENVSLEAFKNGLLWTFRNPSEL